MFEYLIKNVRIFQGILTVSGKIDKNKAAWLLVSLQSIGNSMLSSQDQDTRSQVLEQLRLTLSATVPPLSWISMMCAFFWRRLSSFCWVWQMTLTTEQYFLIWASSFSISFLPRSSSHFLQDLVKAFFLDWDLGGQTGDLSAWGRRQKDSAAGPWQGEGSRVRTDRSEEAARPAKHWRLIEGGLKSQERRRAHIKQGYDFAAASLA